MNVYRVLRHVWILVMVAPIPAWAGMARVYVTNKSRGQHQCHGSCHQQGNRRIKKPLRSMKFNKFNRRVPHSACPFP
jgi:hypothetical protein